MKKIFGILVILVITSQLIFAGIISAKDLAKLAKSGDVVIVSARQTSDYSKKHIKGAVNIFHKDLYQKDGISAMLKSADEIAKIFGEKGITENSKIVIYDNGKGKFAGRLYWIFDYLGAKDVSILDGHIKSWQKARKPVTPKATEITAATFIASPDENKIADIDYVKANKDKDNVILLDVRSADEFNGVDEDKNISRKGHIPGAINLEYNNVLNEDETLKTKEQLAKLFNDAGITSDKEIILYCASSVRAGIVYMVLTSILDYPNVRVYDGAYYEWNASESNPVE
ncbi:MAG TPA: sulfurtransferase [Candidatus Cloacimonetes bacterium]|nr:sulfurtransferase [Candidatus Cloacimonadota bacterium]